MDAAMQGQQLEIVRMNKMPDKSYAAVKMNGQPVMIQLYDGQEASIMQMGNKLPVDEKTKKDLAFGLALVPELHFEAYGIEPTLAGIEDVDGKNAYAIDFESPAGNRTTYYYDQESGLKLRSVSLIKTPQGEMPQTTDYEDYEEVEGLFFPHTIIEPIGPTKLEQKIKNVELNQGIDDSTFSIP
jgi:hypothetical protein